MFCTLLRTRFEKRVHTSEDSVRYTFFAALLRHGIEPEEVVLEYPHLGVPDKKVDTVLLREQQPFCAMEFKYYRAGMRNSPTTEKAGDLFRDLSRLVLFTEPVVRYFVYVTDAEMAGYKALRELFDLGVANELVLHEAYFAGRRATFLKRMGNWPCAAKVRTLVSVAMPNDHHLRIYELWREPDPAVAAPV
jgi:hypothetical protein